MNCGDGFPTLARRVKRKRREKEIWEHSRDLFFIHEVKTKFEFNTQNNLKGNNMKNLSKLISIRFAIAVAAGLAVSTVSSHAQNATATISGVQVGSLFDYTITLKNTGTTSLDSFWYAWTLSGNNLSTAITSPGSSLGWTDTAIEGNTSISWEGNSGNELAEGQSATFTFDSTETPSAITTSPSGESVAYVSGTGPNTFEQNDPGVASPVFSPILVVVPEPSSLGLLMAGLFVMTGSIRSLTVSRKQGNRN